MRSALYSLILLILVSPALGQLTGRMVVWNGDPGCGFRSRSVPKDDVFVCTSVLTERGTVATISHDGVTLSAAFLEDDEYHIVGAGITNETPDPIFFDADIWAAAHYKNRDAFANRKKPIGAETSVPSRDILRVLATGVKYENSLDAFIADGIKTNETKIYRRSDGTTYRADRIIPDKEAQAAAARQNSDRAKMVMNEQRRIRRTALTAKSVQANSSVKGLVYFRRFKESEFVVFSLSVADTTYVFQVPRRKNP